ncbi:hypothetical protein AMECASPLE_015508 [Ameca splendens]|uniref:Ig-like domain-containing protein n=1 Tax=Ameca splendens TaxID=208324 RepID=A0ABV0ZXQ0_9TELE
MGNTSLGVLILLLWKILLCCGQAPAPVLTIDPNWSTFYTGESVTFRCDMNKGKDNDWEYQIRNVQQQVIYNSDKTFILEYLHTGHSGEYQCCGRSRESHSIKCSKTVLITVLDAPRASLTAGSTNIPVGGSVTLSCSMGPSAGWKYRWLRQTSGSYVLVRSDNEENKDIAITKGGIYQCVGIRGNPNFFYSDWVTIQITISNKVFVTRQPNWPQIFSGETITLTCEVQGGETTKWTYEWKRSGSFIYRTNRKDWTFRVSKFSSGDYMCQCRKTDDWYSLTTWSEAITLSVSAGTSNAQLRADSTELPVGGRVTLTCSMNSSSSSSPSSSDWKYFWYRGNKSSEPLTKQQVVFPSNGKISVSEEGQYWCRGGRGEPVYYTDYSDHIRIITVSSPANASLPVMLTVGPLSGIILIILLLLLWRYRRSKGLFCIRCKVLKHTSQSSTTSHGVNQAESHEYTSPLQGGTHLYDFVKSSEVVENVADKSGEVTYSLIEIKNLRKMRRPHEPEEDTIYSEVRTEPAGRISSNCQS